jgi:hypothetical protein
MICLPIIYWPIHTLLESKRKRKRRSMEQNKWEAKEYQVSIRISHLLWNVRVHYRCNNSYRLYSILINLNLVCTLPLYLFNIHFNIIWFIHNFPDHITYVRMTEFFILCSMHLPHQRPGLYVHTKRGSYSKLKIQKHFECCDTIVSLRCKTSLTEILFITKTPLAVFNDTNALFRTKCDVRIITCQLFCPI